MMRIYAALAATVLCLIMTMIGRAGTPTNMQEASPVPLAPDGQALATHLLSLDPALNHIVPADAKVIVAKGENYFGVIEGSAWIPDKKSGYLLFTDFAANVVYKWQPQGSQLSVYLEHSGFTGSLVDIAHEGRMTTTQYAAPLYVYDIGANGIAVDPEGRILLCAQGDRQIVRVDKDGTRVPLATGFNGHRFNHTNSMAVKSDGTIYFTDSGAGVHVPHPPSADVKDALPLSVYMIKDGEVRLAIPDHGHGLAFSPDERFLYVGVGNAIMRFEVQPDDSLSHARLFIDMSGSGVHGGPNQLAVDSEGNMYSGGPGGLWIITASGRHVGTLPLPAIASGLTFGGRDLKTLYILGSRNLFQMRVYVPGMLLPARLVNPVLRH